MADKKEGSEQDDVSFLRTDDMVCLQCIATGERVCLAAEGFGNRHCYLETIADKNYPPDLSTCVFVIEQALSVRALQEMVTAAGNESGSSSAEQGTQSGHRTLLYGHAVLLRHQNSNMYLACLSTSSSNDKLAFDVGLQDHCQGEACWWTIHPASKQRSEGEKVRVGDDLILVSVATERYLHTAKENAHAIVNASFHVTHWSVAPFGTGSSRVKSVGFVFGGEVLRFFHGGDECLTIPPSWSDQPGQNIVVYEGGAVVSQARSLWRLELARTKWSGGYINWSHPLRIRHITTGLYLSLGENNEICLVMRDQATVASSTFCLRPAKDDQKIVLDDKDIEVPGVAIIKYGDTTVFVQHCDTGLWLSYRAYETKKKGVGKVEEKQAILHEEGKMDDGLEFSRSQEEESRTARVIRICGNLFNKFIRGLDSLQNGNSDSLFRQLNLTEMVMCLEDLINYFAQPEDDIEHEEKQNKLRALRNRQDLFQEEGILNLILDAIDKINIITSHGYLVSLAGDETGHNWEIISAYLYQLLAAIIKGNHTNCAQFAQSHRLNWLFSRLGSQATGEGTGMLDVLHCVLIDSPEALNMMKEEHIKVIISLLEKHGRDPKVLDVLSSLCVGNGVAVRSSQNNICDHLLPGRNLLLQTQLVDHVASMRPMIFIGKVDNSTMYRKWYYEATLDHLETATHLTPHMRIGWANMTGYMPYPGGGEKWGGNGVGDDLYSYGFDGANLWTGGRCNNINPISPPYFQKGDVIGCAIDLNIPMITFTLNGVKVKGCFNGFNTDGMFFPVISVSAKLSCRFLLGGDQGRLKYGPPEGFSPLVECLLPNQPLTIEPCFYFGDLTKGVLAGASMILDDTVFVPVPVDTSGIYLPSHIETIRDKLAENIHELWALNKIDAGWSYGEKRDDIKKKHPCLTSFERLPPAEKRYDSTLALQTLKTILSLGYHITVDKPPARIRSIRLHNEPYLQPNGYKPAPLDLSAITLTQRTEELVDHLAENTHNIWAKERIQQGWTYGLHEDNDNKRSPHLVPYSKVDETIKKANRDTASETVRTLLVYGYNLEPPSGETPDSALPGKQDTGIQIASRTYRAEKTYAVTSGKWYFEFEVLTAGPMKVGWARDSLPPGIEIGNDENSWAFDGFNECKYYGGNNENYGKQWQVGDVVGLFLDLNDGTISFSLNGELMMDTLGGETAFSDVQTGEGFVPACTLGLGQRARLTFGQDISALKYFTSCGLQEGYQPFCVNMNRPMTFWYNKDHPAFENTDDIPDCKIEVTRIPAGSDSPPSLKISHKTFETMEKANWEFLRLSLPVTCKSELISEAEKSRNWKEIRAQQRRRKAEMENIRRTPAQLEQQMLKSGFSISDIKGLQRGYSDETHDTDDRHHLQVADVKHQKRKSISKTGSLDIPRLGGLSNGLPDSGDEATEQNLSDDEDKRRRGKSPFRFFKKQRDQSNERPLDGAPATSPLTLEVPTEHSIPVPSGPSLQVPRSPSARRLSQGDMKIVPPKIPDRPGSIKHGRPPSYMGEDDGEGGDYLDDESLYLVNEYYYGVRIFPGQDPNHVYVGWVTTQYHMSDRVFDPQRVRRVTYLGLESDNVVNDICERQNCYMVSAGELLGEVTQQESGARASQGMYIGCFIDSSTGFISFTCEGKTTKHKYQMEPGTKLFPAIFVEATSKEVLQFELGRTKTTLPLSAAVLQSVDKHLTPQCPPRLKIQALCLHQWARVPNISLRVHSLKLSDVRGWSMLCEDPVSMLALHIPEEDRCIDILELIEHERLLIFHAHTLSLYGAVCFQGNYRAAHMLCQHVDQKQLLYAIQSEYMSGPLRIGFYDLLIAIHLEPLAYARSITQSEYIIPLGSEIKSLYENPEMAHSLRTFATVSIRPQMRMSEVREKVDQIKDLGSPYFPVEVLKLFVMSALDDAVKKGNVHNRDPIGGSMENMFVPLIKIADKLFLIELVDDSDLQNLLILIDPTTWDENYDPERDADVKGLLQMHLDEGVKLQMCYLLQHLCDLQFRHRIECIVSFSDDYVGEIQVDQLRRYIEIKQADLPSAVAAKKTREFRCPPKEQMSAILSFKNLEDDSGDACPCNEELREKLNSYHSELMKKVSVKKEEGEGEEEGKPKEETGMWSQKLNKLISIVKKSEEIVKGEESEEKGLPEDIFRQVLITTIVKWAEEHSIESNTLVREMFSLLLRQYDGVGELIRSLKRAYVISNTSRGDIAKLLQHLGIVRALLPVQMGPEEEELLRVSLWALVSNRVFFQHPDLIRILCVHEDVMAVMMSSLGRRAQTQLDAQAASTPGQAPEESKEKDTSHEMVVACCRFLCYFCRSSKQNQKAMFDHFSFLIDNSNILLARPSLRGSTPLDVAYSSLMDNNELALALREHLLEKIAIYLSRCGLQSNQELLEKGYPDIGWDPVEGERYLDFLRFCVWVNGESVEENANLVIRLLIRRPECLGPALRGEGEGLLQAIYEANIMSERINSIKNTQGGGDVINIGVNHPIPNDEDEDYIDMGAAILNFYCVLVDLLGRCAPDTSTIEQGKNESLRARAILRSLVPLEDLEGVLGIQFTLVTQKKDGEIKSDMPTGLVPNHKQSIVMFLERVYGIEHQDVFFRLLENAFLPDLRAATMLEKPEGGESDMALALNRYIGNSILPLLIKDCKFFGDADNYASLLDATLHTVYRLSKCKLLTKGQREAVSDFLVALTREMQPSMLLPLLRKLTTDVSALTEYTTVALRLLTLHFERCNRYYGAAGGQGLYGSASEEEKRLTMMLFSNIFDSLAKMEYDPELFGKALPCLSAIGCALPPDYSLTIGLDDEIYKHTTSSEAGPYNPQPVNTSDIQLNQDLLHMVQKFSEHYHDAWASRKFENGWTYGEPWSDETKTHPRLRPYSNLAEWEKERYKEPIRDALKALLALGWQVEMGESDASRGGKPGLVKTDSQDSGQGYNPRPVDMSNLTLSREMQNMAERLSENAHDIWAQKKKEEMIASDGGGIHPQMVPYDLLTDKEKRKNRERSQELLKYLQFQGCKVQRISKPVEGDQGGEAGLTERRFAYSLLEKLLQYLDVAAFNMKLLRPSGNQSRRNSFKTSSRDVKFFSKVVLPLMEKYFSTHRNYFIAIATAVSSTGAASLKEKEMVASLFCKLAALLRAKLSAFGNDARITVRCLQVLIRAFDAKSIVKSCPEFVRTSMLTFFNNAAEDLAQAVNNLKQQRYSYIRGTALKTSSSLNYIQMVVLPVLTALYDHLAANEYGADLLLDDLQVACYKILNSLYTMGTDRELFHNRKFILNELDRHRPALGTCLGAFASTFPVAFLEPHLNKHNQYSIHGRLQEHSLEAQDIMARLESSMPTLEDLMSEVDRYAESGGSYEAAPHVIDVELPMLCSYLPFWWYQGPDNVSTQTGNYITMVTSEHMNNLLKTVLILIKNNVGSEQAPWMTRIATYTQQIIINSSEELLKDPVLPLATKIHHRVDQIYHKEENLRGFLKSTTEDTSQVEAQLQEEWLLLVRDIYAFYPLLIKYVDLQRAHWLKHGISEAEELYKYVAEIFNIWSLSQYFRREETNFISQHEIDNMTLIMPSSSRRMTAIPETTVQTTSTKKKKRDRDKKRDKDKEIAASLMVACLKRLLPVGLNLFAGREQELVQHAKEKFLKKEPDAFASEYVKNQLLLPEKIDLSDAMSWQHQLYSTLGNKNMETVVGTSVDQLVERIIAMAKVLYGLHMIDHPQTQSKGVYRSVVSIQRKRAVIECFRQTSLHSLPRHKAINIFLRTYRDVWLNDENQGQEILIEDLTQSFEEAELKKKEEEEETSKLDPLMQLIVAFCRNATTEHSGAMLEDKLYMAYADIISRSCSGSDEEEEEEGGEDDQGTSIHEQEMEKQKLLFEQARLADRGVAEMALLHISACKGVQSPMVMNTLQMGISILRGGNKDIQLKMLQHLKDKKDVGFFTSVAGLMNSCSVLDLDAFERNMKAEGLGVGSEGAAGEKNMHDADFTRTLFRFLQLLCEGHNLDFQNYLRTQAGNTTTVNVVICTVDYLLRLQESIMDFYWHYSSKEVIDQSGKNNFFKAIDVAKQVFNTLTEFIQGPCTLNQQALAHSRLWDAVGGFMFLFAHMQDKLSKHSSQVDLLKELLNLQKDMVIMMLSMLEGNVMNGTIGKQMVDTLVESASNVEMLLMFFNMFLKLESLTASPSFREMDTNKDGFITPKDFQKAMEQQKTYTEEEIQYIMQCCDTNHDGKIDYIEFTERFHEPAKDIGFNLAVLLTNLSEHMPSEPRLARFLESASSVLNYFEPYLGRIEIMGSSKRIERVYFEIKESNIEQWEKPQIKESKRAFFYSIVTEGGDKEKLEAFVNFCEDAIFEMQHASSMSAEEGDDMPINRAAAFRYPTGDDEKPQSALEPVKVVLRQAKNSCKEAFSHLTPANIKKKIDELKEKTFAELVVGFFKLLFYSVFYSTWTGYFFIRTIVRFIMLLMRGQPHSKEEEREVVSTSLVPVGLQALPLEEPSSELALLGEMEATPPIQAFGIDITKEDDGYHMAPHETPPEETPQSSIEEPTSEPGSEGEEGSPPPEKVMMANGELVDGAVPVMANHIDAAEEIEVKEAVVVTPPPSEIPSPYAETKPEPSVSSAQTKSSLEETEKKHASELPPIPRIDVGEYAKKFVSFLARHFYNMKYIALVLAFAINFILLFYKVTTLESGDDDGSAEAESLSEVSELEELGLDTNATDEGEGADLLSGMEDEEEELEEWITVEEKVHYLQPTMTILAFLHSLVSFFMLVAYYHLKVPLAIFKREKEIARRLEFDGLYIAEQPAEDDVRSHWDKLVISARSFPVNYWDKFVKKKVRQKYSETYDFDAISNLLGMEKSGSFTYGKESAGGVFSILTNIDWRYQIWKAGVTITDNSFLYILWYFTFSVLGNFNNFFFAAHLLDVAVGFKTLRTILQSVTHNGKQLILTVMLLTIIVYIYTVIAFNFFRKFYIQEEEEQVDRKCHDMLTCFVFHLYKGVRAGGGIGDEIEPPDGDDYEVYRIVFDITFFFFVIVILLAIIQGLIIDAFGELRDQLQSVQDDMESNCFICTIGKDYFDTVPHGFDTHVQKEHNLANYMFFLMHLINKPDTEYTGQETYVWEMYQERCWDFFPVGDCFRKQYEEELGNAG